MVEGYTDVMACHLAGVGTAVASCGTAFGDDHAKVLRRFMADHEEFRGEVIFTFDGDAAGQAAALKAFSGDQNFVSQTYVAVEPDGLDPCDLRIKKGDAAVRELVARRVPLYRFVLTNVVSKYDLDRADGRVDALRESARLVSSIRDRSKVDAFAREIASMVGVDVEEARAEVRRAAHRAPRARRRAAARGAAGPAGAAQPARPAVRDRARDAQAGAPAPDGDRSHHQRRRSRGLHCTRPTARSGRRSAAAAAPSPAPATPPGRGGCATPPTDPVVGSAISELSVEPLPTARTPTADYVAQHVVRLLELTALRRIDQVKSKMQRTNPVEHAEAFNRMFGELAALEEHRRKLRDRIVGVQ